MTSFKDAAIKDIIKDKVADEVEGYLIAALNLIISLGYANPTTYLLRYKDKHGEETYNYRYEETNYYGSCIAKDELLTRDALRDIIDSGLDYSRCTDPAEHTGYGFLDTFTSSNQVFKYLKCNIYSGSGKAYVYALDWDQGFAELIYKLGEYNKHDVKHYASKALKNLNSYYNEVSWKSMENSTYKLSYDV